MSRTRCVSCGTYVAIGDGSVEFKCPECEKVTGRCQQCRKLGKRYSCECGFEGP